MGHRSAAALAVVLTFCLAAFTGTALAGNGNGNNGNGNGNAPQPVAPAPAPAAPAPAAAPAPSKGQAKHAAAHPSTPPAAPTTSDNSTGVKPSSHTAHNTYAPAQSNKTKQYGNGKTAGQIAQQAGYGGATLHGPGNSQPHKVDCGGHEVDVHALKHKSCGAAAVKPAAAKPATVTPAAPCASTSSTGVAGVWHKAGNSGKYVFIHPSAKSAHYDVTKHSDDIPVSATAGANASPGSCAAAAPVVSVAPATAAAATAAPATATPVATQGVAGVQFTHTRPTAPTPAAGGVEAVSIVKIPPKPKAGGVLGISKTVAATHLPFTGIELWIAAVVALALLLAGALVRHAAADRTV